MFALLVKIRIFSLWNVARHTASRHRLLAAGLTALGCALFAGVYFGFRLLFDLIHMPGGVEEMVYDIFFFLFLFLLASAVPFVASTLLHSGDYLLLCAAPMRMHSIAAAKLLDAAVTNSLQFAVIGVPAMAACGAALGVHGAGWWVLLLVVLLFALLPALVTALLLLLALAAFGARRVRRAIATVNGMMATVVCLTVVAQANKLPIQADLRAMFAPSTMAPSASVHLGPSGWFADAFITYANGNTAEAAHQLGMLALLVGALYAACTMLGGRLLSAATMAEEAEGEGISAPVGPVRASRRGVLACFSQPVAALIAKDLRYVMRDSVLLSQLTMPAILFLVPFVLIVQGMGRSVNSPTELYPFAAAMTGVIVFMQTSILALSSIGLENRSYWLLMVSPNGARAVLWAKFAMSTLVSGGIGLLLTLVSALVFRAPWPAVVLQGVIVVLCAAALCGMGVGISAALPRFVYENPAHRVSVWALILGFVANMVYLGAGALLFVTAVLLTTQVAEYTALIYAVSSTAFALFSIAAAMIPMVVGTHRLEAYQWEH